MSNYDVIIEGTVLAGFDVAKAHADLARLTGQSAERVALLLSGNALPVKLGIDAAASERYVAALRGIGVASYRTQPAASLKFDAVAAKPLVDASQGGVAGPAAAASPMNSKPQADVPSPIAKASGDAMQPSGTETKLFEGQMDMTYRAVLAGIKPGIASDQAQHNLAALFKIPHTQAAAILGQPRFVVKKGLQQEVAAKYQAAIEGAGAVCMVEAETPIAEPLAIDLPAEEILPTAASRTPNSVGVCAKCGLTLTPGAAFCTKCGNSVRGESIAAAGAAMTQAVGATGVNSTSSSSQGTNSPGAGVGSIVGLIIENLDVLRQKISKGNAHLGALVGFVAFAFSLFLPWSKIPTGMLASDGGNFNGWKELAFLAIIPLAFALYPMFLRKAVSTMNVLANILIAFSLLAYNNVINRASWFNGFGANIGSELGAGFWIGLLSMVAISIAGIAWSLHTTSEANQP